MTNKDQEDLYFRLLVALGMAFIGFLWVVIASFISSPQEATSTELRLSDVLYDRSSPIYPFTIQNAMWIFFFVCAGELWCRWHRATEEKQQLRRGLLSDDDALLYRTKEVGQVYQQLVADKASRHFFLQRLVGRVALQFQITNSTDQANSLMNSSLELMQHEVDLKYNMIRYMVWLIPTLGFIGTVVGIALALSSAGDMPDLSNSAAIKEWVAVLTTKLGVAFNTTLLSLILSAILVFMMHLAQGREEATLNMVGQYCLDRLVNRLIEEK